MIIISSVAKLVVHEFFSSLTGEHISLLYFHLVHIIEEHLSHLVDWHCGVDGTRKAKFADSIRQGAQMGAVGVGEKHCIDLANHLAGVKC